MLFYPKCLALHFCIKKPFNNFRITHAEANESPAKGAEEEFEDINLMFHLGEFFAISLLEGLSFNNSTLGIGSSLKSVIKPLTRQFIRKTSSITNEDNIRDSTLNSIQRNKCPTGMT